MNRKTLQAVRFAVLWETVSMTKANRQPTPDSFRLRMVYNQWYFYFYADGKELERKGPFGWNIANNQAANYRNDGLIDIDRL
jgi:hypothetical protein